MNDSITNILLHMDGIRCENPDCKARLIIIEKGNRAIIKNRLLVIDEKKGSIEIKCRECGWIKTIISNS